MDHSWTLQAVMEMKSTLAVLVEKTDRLSSDIATMSEKLDTNCDHVSKINTKLAWVAGGASGIIALAIIIWTLINAVPW
ncbi:MAG: hypothetical protein EOO21_01405, partial [Comamonadaceae bacterium]